MWAETAFFLRQKNLPLKLRKEYAEYNKINAESVKNPEKFWV
jgi:hypothetical protein